MGIRPSHEQPFKIFAFRPNCASVSLINKIKISIFTIWTAIIISDIIFTNYFAGLFVEYYLPFKNTSFPVIATCALSYIGLILITISCLRWGKIRLAPFTIKSVLIGFGIVIFLTTCHGISIAIIPAITLEVFVPFIRKDMLTYQMGWESMGYMRDVNFFLKSRVLSQIKKPKHATKLALYDPKCIRILLYTFIHINVLTGENMQAYCRILSKIVDYYVDNVKQKNNRKIFTKNINALFQLEYNYAYFEFWGSKTAFNHYAFVILLFSFFVITIYVFHIIVFWATFGQTYLKYYDYNILLFWVWIIRDCCTMLFCIALIYLYRGEIVLQVVENYSWLNPSLFNGRQIKTMCATKNHPESLFYHQYEATIAYELMYYLYWSEMIKDTLTEVIACDWMVPIIMKYCCGLLQFNGELKKYVQQKREPHPFIPIYVMKGSNYDNMQWIEKQWIYKQMYSPHKDDNEYKTRHAKLIFAWKLVQLLNQTYNDTMKFENDETVPLLKQ